MFGQSSRLVDFTEARGRKSEDIIARVATDELRSFLRFVVHLIERGQTPIKAGRILSLSVEEQAAQLAQRIAFRASGVVAEYPDKAD